MSNSSTPKPIDPKQPAAAVAKPTEPTEAEQHHERMLKLTNELAADAPVFVLVPWDDSEQRTTKALLEDGLLKYFEHAPAVHHELKVARLPYGSQLFVAHPVTTRAKRDDGTFGPVSKLHVSNPIDLKQYTARSADGYTWNTDLGAIIDSVTASCKHTNGFVWLGVSSGDKLVEHRVLKLSKT